jgi:phosphoglycerol transferase MdoB-like AlkP superfamily enzyme
LFVLLAYPFLRWVGPRAALGVSLGLQVLLGGLVSFSYFLSLIVGSPLNKAVIDIFMMGFDPDLQVQGGATALGDSVSHYVTFSSVTFILLCILLPVAIMIFLWKRPLKLGRWARRIAVGVLVTLALITVVLLPNMMDGTILRIRLHTYGLERNSVTALIGSYLRPALRDLFSEKYEFDDPFCLDTSSVLESERNLDNPLVSRSPEHGPVLPGAVPRRTNLVLVLLEAVSSPYLRGEPSPMPFTEGLGKRDGGIKFTEHYSPWPQTMKSLFSMFCSELPYPEYPPITYVNPEIPCVSLPEALKEAGYATAFYSSPDFGFDRKLRYYRHRKFDRMEDMYSMPGREGAWASSWGLDESVTIRAILAFFDEFKAEDKERPVAMIFNMVAGHHPYNFPNGPPDPEPNVEDELRAYRGCLAYIDSQIRYLTELLEKHGYLDDTLLVVLSDHGEAFDQHGIRGHGPQVYEESVHVPFVLYGPQLRGVEGEIDFVTTNTDVAPTLLGLLGVPIPMTMKGRDLTRDDFPRVALFGGRPPAEQYGIRDGKWKLVLSGETGVVELFDVAADPDERTNLVDDHPELAKKLLEKVREWKPHSRNLIENYPMVLKQHGRRCP